MINKDFPAFLNFSGPQSSGAGIKEHGTFGEGKTTSTDIEDE